ncbi:hypothetical protein H4R33_004647 [Dimargaris cristalligena]|uniref:Uncharacterized protein n=1 Tax=Dimargaris cristalligena TaxID=215637 RepID=A0A4P9ZWQ5_9FUNG|nr:hypothetical protein H4R33_004647 [Dimargaris cristalligena]RKP37768.1 hypothetical protein BJ085DRAFT_33905 [Dimargaris cristalligena]|eukprot:RKP37768.1 hypothetical protein BJ085DRAFT_33905 [Dimargaris cristalligena]
MHSIKSAAVLLAMAMAFSYLPSTAASLPYGESSPASQSIHVYRRMFSPNKLDTDLLRSNKGFNGNAQPPLKGNANPKPKIPMGKIPTSKFPSPIANDMKSTVDKIRTAKNSAKK